MAWDCVFSAWDPESHAEYHAEGTLAWEANFGVEFGVGIDFWHAIRRGNQFLAWNSAWDFSFGVGDANPMPNFGVEDPLGMNVYVCT